MANCPSDADWGRADASLDSRHTLGGLGFYLFVIIWMIRAALR
jgi:hypothetical protein